ncbi:Vta1 like-domain-containing protein [Absidia repens]|uniref:Vta1 like-domain-containing protein n=1 Tax=Absidia repens TaxID=90262 RepID=A0A1X2IWD2_9FUNG|nr:Vta1 like-domain-containing protein [Absidia repens]
MEIPEELKYLAPYIQRGQELNSREPVIAYYAHYYAVKLAISRGPSNQTTNAYLSHLLDALEQQKQALGADNEAIKDDLVGYAHVENFALKVFLSADNEDRSGQASKKTAKTFLAASVFLELLKTFGDLDAEVEAKIKYAKWKAADIIKALREGRVPTPDEPSTQAQPQLPSAISDFPSPPSNFTAPLAGQSNNQSGQISPPSGKVSSSSSTHSTSPAHSFSQSLPSHEPITPSIPQPTTHDIPTVGPVQIAAAQKNAKWAISALNYDDIKTARTQLLDALNDLGYNRQNNFGF